MDVQRACMGRGDRLGGMCKGGAFLRVADCHHAQSVRSQRLLTSITGMRRAGGVQGEGRQESVADAHLCRRSSEGSLAVQTPRRQGRQDDRRLTEELGSEGILNSAGPP